MARVAVPPRNGAQFFHILLEVLAVDSGVLLFGGCQPPTNFGVTYVRGGLGRESRARCRGLSLAGAQTEQQGGTAAGQQGFVSHLESPFDSLLV
jgi:hypothetical protein